MKDGSEVWYARIVRTDGSGKKKQFTAKGDNKTHARTLRDQLERNFGERGEAAIEGNKLRFHELADLFERRRLTPAKYHGSGGARRKVSGLRSLQPSQHYLRILREYFSTKLVHAISHADIEDFKIKRLNEPTSRGERSISDVNRVLELLRAILRFAARNGWIMRTPFELGSPLISKADENRRERILTFEEEARLLDACRARVNIEYTKNGRTVRFTRRGGRTYLLALVTVAVDTAMRKGELLKLTWHDVDFEKRVITIVAMNSKTARERRVGMTNRTFEVLQALWSTGPSNLDDLVFGIRDNFKAGFRTVLTNAGIEDFHFHDLRHTAITRMVAAGLPPMQIMKISGHQQWSTFARYVNPGYDTVTEVAQTMTAYNEKNTQKVAPVLP